MALGDRARKLINSPELIAELGAPWNGLWELLSRAHGELEAARVLARLSEYLVSLSKGLHNIMSAAVEFAIKVDHKYIMCEGVYCESVSWSSGFEGTGSTIRYFWNLPVRGERALRYPRPPAFRQSLERIEAVQRRFRAAKQGRLIFH